MNDELFTLPELGNIIDAQKNNKTPGPDGCRAELVKWLSVTNRNSLLSLYNDMIQRHEFPESFKKANLVAIYKKGDATQMQNYRPIALLQVFYKILAGMIRTRLLHAYDPWIQKSQLRFSPQEINNTSYFHSKKIIGSSRKTAFEPVTYFIRLGESFRQSEPNKTFTGSTQAKSTTQHVSVDC